MNALRLWLKENGAEGRQALLAELQQEFPRLSSTSLSQYALGKRVPERERAEIIARFIGVPLEKIPYRMVNRPPREGGA